MEDFEIGNLLYLIVLGTAVAGWFIAENRRSLGQTTRMALVWGLIFLGFIAGFGLWNDVRDDLLPRQSVVGGAIEVPRSGDGHFHLTLTANGQSVPFLVDTGATDIVLTRQDAERVGLDPGNLAFLGTARTANGEVRTAFARLDELALGPVVYRNVPVSVNGGDMDTSLLGMNYLSRFDRLEIEDNRLRLVP